MPEVFTVYNCGTAFNRQRPDELVANLASRTQGAENREWLVNDGPGSAPTRPTGPMPGDRTRAAQAKTPGRAPDDINPAFVTQAKGIITGHGWEHNVAHTVQVLEAIASRAPEQG